MYVLAKDNAVHSINKVVAKCLKLYLLYFMAFAEF